MRKVTCLLAMMLVFTSSAWTASATIELATDRRDGIYRRGEAVRFLVTLRDGPDLLSGRGLAYTVVGDSGVALASGSVVSGEKPAPIVVATSKSEIFRCDVTFKTDATTQPVTSSIGAAVEPEKIAPSLPMPDDFDAFWTAQKKLLEENPAEAKLTPVKSSSDAIEAFDVQIPDGPPGTNVSAYYARPKGAKPKSLPAILYPHSAGVRDSDLPHAIRGAKLGAIALDFNAHGVPNGRPPAFYAELLKGGLKDYASRGMQDREKVYFRGMYLRGQRALAFLTQQLEWDGKILIVEGSSQGGAQAIVAAALDERVTLCLAAVPALSDLTGPVVNRLPGWPKMLARKPDGSLDAKAVEALRYVDVMNFASRLRCPTIVSVGLIDKTCPPASVYAAYNNIPATTDKSLVARAAMGHAFPRDLIEQWDGVIAEHVKSMRNR